MIKRYFAILLLSLTLVAGSCTQQRQPCVEPILVSLRFSTWSTRTVVDSAVQPVTSTRVSFDTILPYPVLGSVNALHDTSYRFISGGSFYLFLNPNKDTCTWYLKQNSDSTIIDTITFYYTRKLQFLSNACGYTYYYNLTAVPSTPNLKNNIQQNPFDTTRHRIDSIIIENPSVTNDVNVEHMKIFIHNPF